MNRFLVVLIFFQTFLVCGQTTPPHYYHNPPNCGVNNLFFISGACNKFQFIYTQTEIAAMTTPVSGMITISRIWFRHGGGASDLSTTLSNLVIKMGHTTLSNPTGQFNSNFNAGAPVTVFSSANYNYIPLTGAFNVTTDNWTFIDLQTPFNYNFTNNLCVEISFSNSSGFIAGNYADNGGIPISQYASSNAANTANASSSRPVFGISSSANPCPPVTTTSTQTNVSCSGGSDGSVSVVASGGMSFSYVWSPSGGSTATATGLIAGDYTCTITNECGNSTTQTFVITGPSAFQLNASVIQPTCGNNNGCISFAPTPAGTYFFTWPFPSNWSVDNVCDLGTGAYEITINSENGCPIDTSIVLTNSNALTIDASPDISTINFGDTVQLNATGGITYSWSPSLSLDCSNCSNPMASPQSSTTYVVVGTDANGCEGGDTVSIVVITEPEVCGEIFVPTVFSPNGTGTSANKTICVYGGCVSEIRFEIFNRWGEKVFETTNINLTECWDGTYKGKEMNAGTFVYKLIVTRTNNEIIEQTGNINLIR